MDASNPELRVTAPPSVYEVGGQRLDAEEPAFSSAIAAAHASRQRPRCLCVDGGVEMYIARLASPGRGFIVKRMPDTGSRHAAHCPSYEPPAELSGLGQVLGSAIVEDPATGETTLKLDFALSRLPGRSTVRPAGHDDGSVRSDGTKLSLRGLLHYLWDQAELTRWQPGFAGRRSWATVRKHLLMAAEHKVAKGDPLLQRLYVPEVFSVEQRDAINARRLAQWSPAVARPGKPQQLMLMIAEVKEIVPARFGYRAVIKHVPDQAFTVDEQLYRRLGRRFEAELAMWGAADDLHLVMIATFGLGQAGVPVVSELCVMAVTQQWLPIEDEFERQLVERLVWKRRSFVKGLRYDLQAQDDRASALLTDTGPEPLMLWIDGRAREDLGDSGDSSGDASGGPRVWHWNRAVSAMPALPVSRLAVAGHHPAEASRYGCLEIGVAAAARRRPAT